jgi:hypothetical protein
MGSKRFGLVAAVGGVLLLAAAGTPAQAFGWCKGGTHGWGAAAGARTAAVAPAPVAKKRHAWRSGRAYGYAAAPVRGYRTVGFGRRYGYSPYYGTRYGYRYGYGPYYGYRSGVAIGVSVGDRDRRFRFRDRDRRYGFRDRDDRRTVIRDRDRRYGFRDRGDDRDRGMRRAGFRASADARESRTNVRASGEVREVRGGAGRRGDRD